VREHPTSKRQRTPKRGLKDGQFSGGKAGKNLSVVARALSASVSSVFRWYRQYKRRGTTGLKPRPTPGRQPRLSNSQKINPGKVLLKGPLAAGYRTDLWTLQRVAKVIRSTSASAFNIIPAMSGSC